LIVVIDEAALSNADPFLLAFRSRNGFPWVQGPAPPNFMEGHTPRERYGLCPLGRLSTGGRPVPDISHISFPNHPTGSKGTDFGTSVVAPSIGGVNWTLEAMPPTFVYLLCFMIWLFCAVLVWLVAGLMFLIRSTRATSRSVCLAMAATFPFLFAYQIAAGPLVAGLLFVAWASWKILDPGASATTQNPIVIVVSIGIALLSFCAILGMSLAGFYDGWRTGWACGEGRRFRDALSEAPTLRLLFRLLQKAPLRSLSRFASVLHNT
jgi:hypothetical protein